MSGKKLLKIVLPTLIIFIIAAVGLGVIISGSKRVNKMGKTKKAPSVNNLADDNGQAFVEEEIVDSLVEEEVEDETIFIDRNAIAQSGPLNTGNLTEAGDGYEGIKGTGDYNYGEALQKSLLFYELQRSGDIDESNVRCNWRGDSCLNDGADNGLDLSGGWFDAGDNVKFNLPMAYTASVLAWSIYEDKDAYKDAGQLDYAMANIKWANDYFIKCHPEDNVYYYQVGNGSIDHSWWGPAECVETATERPSYKVTKDSPGSCVVAETAASLAACSKVYEGTDDEYSELCLEHAKSLFKFAEDTKSDAGYTEANGFYTSNSGFYDELAWAGTWLYIATGEEEYLDKAEEYYSQACQDYNWALCWDDVHIGAATLLANITGDKKYKDAVETHLDYWTTGTSDGDRITYTPEGLAWLDTWGSLRYATTTAYVASVYSTYDCCDKAKKDTYWNFAVSQCNYALGDTGFSYQIGFGNNYPMAPHHRTAQGSYVNNMNEPAEHRHTLYGALVGGPDANDGYVDEVSNYTTNEVACDYNAGFTGLLAKMYSEYHGETLKDFGAVEQPEDEISAEACVNVDGQDFIEIRAFVYNKSAWPARVAKNLEMRYYVDLSEVYNDGKTVDDIEITTNYMQGGAVNGLVCQDEDNHIYYLSVDFSEDKIYPGGQDAYKREVQIRMRNPEGSWDNSNDPSYACLSSSEIVPASTFALFEDGELVYGQEP